MHQKARASKKMSVYRKRWIENGTQLTNCNTISCDTCNVVMSYHPLPTEEVESAPFLDPPTVDESTEEEYQLPVLKAKFVPKNPRRSVGACYKTLILICVSIIAFGVLFVYDSVSALEGHLTQDLSLSKSLYGFFFSLYALPNIVLVVCGGVLIDRIDNRKSGLLFGSLILLGSLICAIAPTLKRLLGLDSFIVYLIMLGGRFIFG